MIGDNPKFDEFISEHRWAVITTLRKAGTASSSVVAYARDGDTLIVSTPGYTFKKKSLEKDPRITLCCINDEAPFNFVTVEGRAEVTRDDIVRLTKLVFANIQSFGFTEPDPLEKWLESQERVIIKVHPERVYGVIR